MGSPNVFPSAQRPPPTRLNGSRRHWARHIEAGERIAELLEELQAAAAQHPGLAGPLQQLEGQIANADAAAWNAIKALEREQRQSP